MKPSKVCGTLLPGVVILALMTGLPPDAQAVPSFSRQTGLACNVCHCNPPELTAFGRKFKLDGYTLTDRQAGSAIEEQDLKINRSLPLSVMLLLSNAVTKTPVPGAQGGNAEFPQALSIFLASEVSPDLGGMLQVTYSHESDHFSMDNTDIRYAKHTILGSKDILFGLTLNNSPSVEDAWNSTPAWGYPWISPGSPPTPSASPVLVGTLAQDVAGLGAYSLWNDHLYADLTLYRSDHAAGPQPLTGVDSPFNIHGVAPYWRLAWQQTWGPNYVAIGTFGMYVSSVPGGISGPRDTYSDSALDFQFERPFGTSLLTFHAAYLHESSTLNGTAAAGGAATPSHNLNMFRADATWHLRRRYTFTLAAHSTTGSSDPLLFAPAAVTGSLRGSPNSSGFVGQAGFWPKQNIELSLACTGWATFNGARRNYDGFGRKASANNSIYIALWLNY